MTELSATGAVFFAVPYWPDLFSHWPYLSMDLLLFHAIFTRVSAVSYS
jgi:hypothetical protein